VVNLGLVSREKAGRVREKGRARTINLKPELSGQTTSETTFPFPVTMTHTLMLTFLPVPCISKERVREEILLGKTAYRCCAPFATLLTTSV
jgi:hypothetical protein